MALRGPSLRPRPKPTKSIVAPQKHNVTQKTVPRPVPKPHGPTLKSKPIPRGKPATKPVNKTKPRTQRLKRVPLPPKRRTRSVYRSPTRSPTRSLSRTPNRTVFAKLLAKFGLPPNFRPPSPPGLPNPLHRPSPEGLPPNFRPPSPEGLPNPLHRPPSPPPQSNQKNRRMKLVMNRSRIGSAL